MFIQRMDSLKDKLAASRRAHLAEAALSVFAEKGYHRATIRDVARAAGVADGTIYASFASKEALLLALLDPLDELASLGGAAAAAPNGELGAFLRTRLSERFAALTPERLDALRVVLSEALVDEELRRIVLTRVLAPTYALPVPAFEALAAAGRLNAPDAAFAARAMTAAVLGLAVLRLLGEPSLKPWGETAERLAELLLEGLLPRGKAA